MKQQGSAGTAVVAGRFVIIGEGLSVQRVRRNLWRMEGRGVLFWLPALPSDGPAASA